MNEDKKIPYGIIYIITNIKNNKSYIGQTTQKGGFKKRYKNNVAKNTHNPYLKRAMDLYGIDNFFIEENFDVAYSKEELDSLEEKYIREYKTFNPKYGYNLTPGGENHKLSPLTKEKLRNANLGKKYSEEVNRKKASCGPKNGMYNKKHSEKAIKLMSEKRKGKFCGFDSPVAQPVRCKTTGRKFPTIDAAGKCYNIKSPEHIRKCLDGKLNSCGKLQDGTPLEWELIEGTITKPKSEKQVKKHENMKKYIICLNDCEIFRGAEQVGQFYKLKSYHHISDVCLGKSNYCGCHPETLEPLKFIYLKNLSSYFKDSYNKLYHHIEKFIILMLDLKNSDRNYIICLNDCKKFKTQKECGEFYKLKSYHHISDVCLGKSDYCGRHPETLEPLRFIYSKNILNYLDKFYTDLIKFKENIIKVNAKLKMHRYK